MFKTHPEPIRDLLTADYDPHDPYAWTMGHWFAIVGTLYADGHDIPAGWEFSPGARAYTLDPDDETYPDCEWVAAYLAGYITADDMRRAGNVLARYARLLDHAGRSY